MLNLFQTQLINDTKCLHFTPRMPKIGHGKSPNLVHSAPKAQSVLTRQHTMRNCECLVCKEARLDEKLENIGIICRRYKTKEKQRDCLQSMAVGRSQALIDRTAAQRHALDASIPASTRMHTVMGSKTDQ